MTETTPWTSPPLKIGMPAAQGRNENLKRGKSGSLQVSSILHGSMLNQKKIYSETQIAMYTQNVYS